MSLGLTKVRHDEKTARQLLQDFIFGGMFGPGRVPRGIEPALISDFIRQRLEPESGADAYVKSLEAMRFYERDDVVPHLLRALTRQERDLPSIRRSAYAIQAAGDLGPSMIGPVRIGSSAPIRPAELPGLSAEYLDRVLVPLPDARLAFPVLLETSTVLAPAGSTDRLAERIQQEVDEAALTERQDESGMMAYDKVVAIQRNDLQRTRAIITKKLSILTLSALSRREELLTVYMGRSAANGVLMETWAGRLLRLEALTIDPTPVRQAFERAIDDVMSSSVEKSYADFLVARAAQAIVYLGGVLSRKHAERYAQATEAAANFLWDDA